MREALGAIDLSSSMILGLKSVLRLESPVMLSSGRPRLLTNPLPTGSFVGAITIGIVRVAFWAALMTGVAPPTMTSTLSATSSDASFGNRGNIAIGESATR